MVFKSPQETTSEIAPRLVREVHSYALPVIAAGVLLAILYFGRAVFVTAMIAVIIALILEPFVGLLVRLRLPRSIATFIVGLIAILVFYLVGFAAWNQISGLAGDVPAFREHLSAFITGVSDRIQKVEDSTRRFVVPEKKTDPPACASPRAEAQPQSGSGCAVGRRTGDSRRRLRRDPGSQDP